MLLDPISVVNEWWRWTSPGFYFRGVTVGNYIGWFFLLFYFGALFERTVLQLKGFRGLSIIEKMIFKTNTYDLSNTDLRIVANIFYFRLIVFLPVFYLSCALVAGFTAAKFANNLGPFNSVFQWAGNPR
jgi:uncharacterized membrane protein